MQQWCTGAAITPSGVRVPGHRRRRDDNLLYNVKYVVQYGHVGASALRSEDVFMQEEECLVVFEHLCRKNDPGIISQRKQ